MYGPTVNSTRHPEPHEGRLRAARLASLSGATAHLAARAKSSRRVVQPLTLDRLGWGKPTRPVRPWGRGLPRRGAEGVPAGLPSFHLLSDGRSSSEVQGGARARGPRRAHPDLALLTYLEKHCRYRELQS